MPLTFVFLDASDVSIEAEALGELCSVLGLGEICSCEFTSGFVVDFGMRLESLGTAKSLNSENIIFYKAKYCAR